MTDEVQVVTLPDADTVAVPQPAIEVLTEQVITPIVIESPETEVVVLDDEVHVVEALHDMSVVSVGEQGPAGSIGATGPQGPAGSVGGFDTYTAGQDLGGHRVVVTNAAGELIYAENTDATHADQAARITTQAASSGADITVQVTGAMFEGSWAWTPGAALYVGTNGLMTHTVPSSPAVFSKVIAVAETATQILIVNFPPVILA
jgi:hypothetical protein